MTRICDLTMQDLAALAAADPSTLSETEQRVLTLYLTAKARMLTELLQLEYAAILEALPIPVRGKWH
ncbi:hypothetical protein [Sinorhizobium fredii]|uniref:hypothetical protein n=1 Tax=Rhizobium fredii TaxID=380 RepID=UPI0004ACD8FD|nr:hypothetical protein [Sinorhizobium fredii]